MDKKSRAKEPDQGVGDKASEMHPASEAKPWGPEQGQSDQAASNVAPAAAMTRPASLASAGSWVFTVFAAIPPQR